MFLKTVDLLGFKSFADKVRIEFSQGISAVVGPNGCGKSNVVDAVKWVLGEQATKSLRAERMEDIIFNGTQERKALNVAEVTLTLENNGELPLDSAEIAVRRRLFRSGESEYYVNGAPVRLKELRELFYDTGIGKSAYSIMEQGKIDLILSSKPEDRRTLFEEAAGITRYKMRAREAERKLERTEANMHEAQSVLAEVKRRYDTLQSQAAKTEQYRGLQRRLFDAEVLWQRLRLRELQNKSERGDAAVSKAEEQRSKLKASIDSLNERLEIEVERVSAKESDLSREQKQVYGLELRRSGERKRADVLRQQVDQSEERLAAERQRVASLESRHAQLERSMREAEQAADASREQIGQIDAGLADVEERIGRSRTKQSDHRSAIEALRQDIAAARRELAERLEEHGAVVDELVQVLDRSLRESGYSTHARTRAEADLAQAIEQATILVRGRREALVDRVSILSEGTERASAVTEALTAIEAALEAIESSSRAYRATIPSFVDDLLAPEGTITRKRELDEAIIALGEREERDRAEIETRERDIEALQEAIEKDRAIAEDMRVNRAAVEAAIREHERAVRALQQQLTENRQATAELQQRIERETAQLAGVNDEIAQIEVSLTQMEQEENAGRERIAQLKEQIESENSALRAEERVLKENLQQLAGAQRDLEAAQMQAAERRAEIRALHEAFKEQHGRDLTEFDALPIDDAVQIKDAKAAIATLKNELRELGHVNLMAVEEFEEVRDRYEFLGGQLADLSQARDDLGKVTEEIHRESLRLFEETYQEIRKNFHEIFRRLFGGGRAELRLAEPDDALASGIEILVQPPGKKLESITLLSGGERSMTAVALLFATFMVRPAPFTLLDEIDAALDERNVGRFMEMLRDFADRSQFIVITHNKRTVVGANSLLGVTMEENGVSKVVSVKVSEEQEVAS